MNRTSIASLIGFLFTIFIFLNIFVIDDSSGSMDYIFPIIIGFGVLSSIFRNINRQKNKKTDDNTMARRQNLSNIWDNQVREKHKCEYCGEMNDIEREYCENCGAKQLHS